MVKYETTDIVIEESLTYLDAIYKWLENDHSNFKSKNLVLVGGWAVDSFNPWFGSIDIDLVTNSRIRNSLQHYLKRELKFRTEEILPGSKTVAKVTEDGKNIVIDFIQKIMTFEGQGNIKFDVQQCLKELVVREVRGKVKALVPAKSYLFILKLKSVWDRTYRLENDLSKDVEWEKGKLAKDCGDILSLLDHVEPLDRFVLRDFFEQYPFLRSAFSFVANSDFSPGKFLPYRPKNTVELIRSIKKIKEL